MSDQRSSLLLVVSVLVMGGVCGGLFMLRNCSKQEEYAHSQKPVEPQAVQRSQKEKALPSVAKKKAQTSPEIVEPSPELSSLNFETPDQLVKNLEAELLKVKSTEDLAALFAKLGVNDLTEADIAALYQRMGKRGEHLQLGNVLDEVGEINRRSHARWALNFKDGGRAFFDLKKGKDGWKMDRWLSSAGKLPTLDDILSDNKVAQLDSLMVAHSFVQFAIQQDFAKARQLADAQAMSDVQLAGLCIIFEEGEYKMREPRGVMRMFQRPIAAGYTVSVVAKDLSTADFSLLLQRPDEQKPWRVKELNFSSLLESFIAARGGDSHFSPMVKNPKGGDSIVVYFAFDEKVLSARTQRQLRIVANVLKLDSKRKITLTGHTDALGSSDYNKKLSQKRAVAVKEFLVSQGVGEAQIVTVGHGAYRPRKANTLADGSDNPEGRKANRRTEIYLDF